MTAKSIVIKGCSCRFGSCAEKDVELTLGGLYCVLRKKNKTEEAERQPNRNTEVSRGHSNFLKLFYFLASTEIGKQRKSEE